MACAYTCLCLYVFVCVSVCGNLGHSTNDQIIIQLMHTSRRGTQVHKHTCEEKATIGGCVSLRSCLCEYACVDVCVSVSVRAPYVDPSCAPRPLPARDDEVTGPSLLTSQFNLDLHNPGVNFHRVHPSGVSRQVTGVRQLSHVPLLRWRTGATETRGGKRRVLETLDEEQTMIYAQTKGERSCEVSVMLKLKGEERKLSRVKKQKSSI